jgi:hypothetical protein
LQGCCPEDPICFSPWLYRARNLVKWFFRKIQQGRLAASGVAGAQPTMASLQTRINPNVAAR